MILPSKGRLQLASASLLVVASMSALVPWLTGELGPAPGYFAVFLIYWFVFCIPLGLYFQGFSAARQNLSLRLGGRWWVPPLVFLQVSLVAVAASLLGPSPVSAPLIAAAGLASVVNGMSEEFFWRGAYLEQGRGSVGFQALGVALFALWHVPLSSAHGVRYEGGPVALVVGACVLGAFWSVLANRTNRIGWPVLAHVFTNAFTFPTLLSTNFA